MVTIGKALGKLSGTQENPSVSRDPRRGLGEPSQEQIRLESLGGGAPWIVTLRNSITVQLHPTPIVQMQL